MQFKLFNRLAGNYTTSIAYANRNQSHVITPFLNALELDFIHINQLVLVRAKSDGTVAFGKTRETLEKLGFQQNLDATDVTKDLVAMYNSEYSIELHLCAEERWSSAIAAFEICQAMKKSKAPSFFTIFSIIETKGC